MLHVPEKPQLWTPSFDLSSLSFLEYYHRKLGTMALARCSQQHASTSQRRQRRCHWKTTNPGKRRCWKLIFWSWNRAVASVYLHTFAGYRRRNATICARQDLRDCWWGYRPRPSGDVRIRNQLHKESWWTRKRLLKSCQHAILNQSQQLMHGMISVIWIYHSFSVLFRFYRLSMTR